MSVKAESLEELDVAFSAWRRGKKHVREPLPEELRVRAQRAAKRHGMTAVFRVTRVERSRLFRSGTQAAKTVSAPPGNAKRRSGPAFSRLTLSAPSVTNRRPIAELERSGVTLRVFEPTPEMMALLSTACGLGAMR